MTAVAGVVHRGKVWIGADSAGISGTDLTVRRDPKVIRNGPFLFGFSGSFRIGQSLTYRFTPPALPPKRSALDRYMVVDFVDALRECLRTGGAARVDEGEEAGGHFLAGIHGRLYQIESDYQVGEARDTFAAIGCGAAYALGSLFATPRLAPLPRVRLALQAAERHSGGVRGPFLILAADR